MTAALSGMVATLGATFLFGWEGFASFARYGARPTDIIDQMYKVGVRSLPTTIVVGLFVGAMAIQLELQLRDFGAKVF